jgi:TatD DNase family protein
VLTDTHCHLDFEQYDQDRDAVLARAREAGLERILVPGIDLSTSLAAIRLATTQIPVYAGVGIHPNSSLIWEGGTYAALAKLADHPKVVALGEIGLDYYRDRAPKKHQKRVFQQQLDLASELKLPVVVHTRNASHGDRSCISDVIQILSEWGSNLAHPGVVHSYSGNGDEARQLLDLGFFIGVTGPVTFKNAVSLQEVVASIPLNRLLIETDGPFLTPHPHRGKRNEPAFVRFIAEKMSEINNHNLEYVISQTAENAQKLFNWREVD